MRKATKRKKKSRVVAIAIMAHQTSNQSFLGR